MFKQLIVAYSTTLLRRRNSAANWNPEVDVHGLIGQFSTTPLSPAHVALSILMNDFEVFKPCRNYTLLGPE